MMKNILVVYSTMSGTTADVARTVAEELKKSPERTVELKPISEARDLTQYDAFVIGAPMIVGWHRDLQKFLRQNQNVLAGKPVALFATAMSLTETGENSIKGVPIFTDPGVAVPPRNPKMLSPKERYSAASNYAGSMIKAVGKAKPVSVALFGGRLDIYRLKIWAALFVMVIIRAKPARNATLRPSAPGQKKSLRPCRPQ
jgi:menaquinone-dependent protoporphyrinogen IX oxidase